MSVSTPGSDRGPLLPRRRPGPPTPANDWHESARIPCRTPPAFNERPRAGRNDQPGTVRAVQPLSAFPGPEPPARPRHRTRSHFRTASDRHRPDPGDCRVTGQAPPSRGRPGNDAWPAPIRSHFPRPTRKRPGGGPLWLFRWYSMTGHLHEGLGCRRVPFTRFRRCFPGSAPPQFAAAAPVARCVLSAFRVQARRGSRVGLRAGHSRLDTAVDGLLRPRAVRAPSVGNSPPVAPRSTIAISAHVPVDWSAVCRVPVVAGVAPCDHGRRASVCRRRLTRSDVISRSALPSILVRARGSAVTPRPQTRTICVGQMRHRPARSGTPWPGGPPNRRISSGTCRSSRPTAG